MPKLNPKQEKFILEYQVDQNGVQSCRRSGYKGSDKAMSVQAVRLLANDRIRQAIDAGLAKQKERIEKKIEATLCTKEQWLERLHSIAFADVGQAFQPDANGKLTMTIQQMKDSGFSKLIRKIKVLPGGKVEFDLHPIQAALDLLGRSQGWVKDQIELSGAIGTNGGVTGEEAQRIHANPEMAKNARALALGMINGAKAQGGRNGKGK